MNSQLIHECAITDVNSTIAELIEAQSAFPLIEISRKQEGINVGGILHTYPTSLSDIYVSLNQTQEYLLTLEQKGSSLS